MNCRWTLLLVAILPVACGNSPTTPSYTLKAVDGARSGGALHTMPIGGPGNRIEVSDQDRWAAPLNELIRRALTEDLRERLPPGSVLAAGDTMPATARTIMLNVQQFMADGSGRVELDADWATHQHNTKSATRHAAIEVRTTGQGGDAVAAAMSEALAQLADRITADL